MTSRKDALEWFDKIFPHHYIGSIPEHDVIRAALADEPECVKKDFFLWNSHTGDAANREAADTPDSVNNTSPTTKQTGGGNAFHRPLQDFPIVKVTKMGGSATRGVHYDTAEIPPVSGDMPEENKYLDRLCFADSKLGMEAWVYFLDRADKRPEWLPIEDYKESHIAVWITDGKNMELCHHKINKWYNCYTDTLTQIVPIKFITIPRVPKKESE